MKKVILIIIAVAGIVSLIGLPVLAAAYTYQMTMVETSGNTYSSFPFISTVGNSSLVSNGYMSPSGLDTQVVDGSSLPAMLTNTQTLFVDNLNANQNKTFQYTTGNTPATSMPIIVGNGGYITTADTAALEPANNFSIVANGYLNTTSGSNLNIVNKAQALVVNVDPSTSGTIDSGIYGYGASYPTVVNTNTNADSATTNHTVNLPTSIVSGNLLIIYFLEYASGNNAATNTPANWTRLVQQGIGNAIYASQYLYTVFYKVATGSEGATVTVTTTASDVSISESYQISGYTGVPVISSVLHSTYVASAVSSIPFSSLSPSWGSAATLWLENIAYENQPTDIAVSSYSTSFTNGLNVHSGSGGLGSAYRNDTTATESPSSATMASAVFYASSLIGIAPTLAITKSVSVAGISSGVHTITCSETTASGGTFSLQIDAGTPATVTSAGSVFDNANNWLLNQNNVMPYITYYKMTVSGTEVLKYQPITIISGTTLPDLDTGDGVQNGAITFGNNPAGISITLGSFGATAPSQAAAGTNYANQSPGTIISDAISAPPQLYTELDTSKIPFGAAVDAILNAGGIPRALWWFPFIYFGICIAGMMIYEATSPQGVPQMGSLLAMCVAIEVLLVIFGVMGTVGVSGMIPLWSAIMFIFPAGALILSRKHVGWG